MEAITEQEVFTFDQLSDDAKDKARMDRREAEGSDFDTEYLYESFQTAAKILGITLNPSRGGGDKIWTPDIRWSGFSSQGDGASFVGSYSHAPNSPAKIRAEFPEETILHGIADRLEAMQCGHRLLTGNRIMAQIRQRGNYCHEMTMYIEEMTDSKGEEFEFDFEDAEELILDLMRNFARWMYKELEAEWDYRHSDEYINEVLSDAEFDEDGELV